MTAAQKYIPFFTSALLMSIALLIIYPHYQYYIDPDGTAYLTISKRYADGDFQKAINGLWSPWGCWLTALVAQAGMAIMPAAVIVNAVGAACFLFISQSFFLKFNITNKLQWVFNITLALFLCYAVFWQSFDDLWGCFFLLAALRIMLADKFKNAPLLWGVCGVVGGLAYFAKSYSFPFFILNTICCTYFIAKGNKVQWLKICFTAISVMILCSLPWIYALHYKYGIWLTSTAAPLNLAWFLVGHPYYKEGIDLLLPPPYKDSPSLWEDPWFIHGALPHFWDSWRLAGREVMRVGFNAYKLMASLLQLSVFFPLIGVIAIRAMWLRKGSFLLTEQMRIVVLSCLLLPTGYFFVSFESRYLWYMLPLGIVLGTLFMQRWQEQKWHNILLVIFPLTFLIYPAICMKRMYNEGADEYKIAGQLKKLNIHGAFTCMAKPGIESQRMGRIAYFSGNQWYTLSRLQYTPQEVLSEMRRYHIEYFFVYGQASEFTNEEGKAFLEIGKGNIIGLKIYQVNP